MSECLKYIICNVMEINLLIQNSLWPLGTQIVGVRYKVRLACLADCIYLKLIAWFIYTQYDIW